MTIVTILIIIVCFLLGAVVLIQNPKGGGLSGSFGGVGQQLLGAKNSTDVVEKSTWGFAAALLILCFLTAGFIDKSATAKKDVLPKSEIEKMQTNKPGAFSVPTSPAKPGAPATQQPATPPAQ